VTATARRPHTSARPTQRLPAGEAAPCGTSPTCCTSAVAAKTVWQQIIDTQTDEGSPEMALSSMARQLGSEGDPDDLRAAYHAGIASGNPSAPDALVEIGNVLQDRGDLDES
jgi:hypothetical protein